MVRRNNRNRNKDCISEDFVGDKYLKIKDFEEVDVKVGIGIIGSNDVLIWCLD